MFKIDELVLKIHPKGKDSQARWSVVRERDDVRWRSVESLHLMTAYAFAVWSWRASAFTTCLGSSAFLSHLNSSE